MIKKTKRKAFNFLRSYFDVLNELTNDKDKLDFLTAIINKQFLNEDPIELNFIVNLCYESQRHQIETSVKGWLRATKEELIPTLPTTPMTTLPTTPMTDGKEEEEEEKEEVKVKESIDSRKLKFSDSLKPFLDTYGKDTLNDFYGYWTEKSEKDKKMRFEKQTSFDIKRRLTTWTKNDFNKKKEVTPDNLTPDVLYIMKQTGLTYEQLKG